MRAHFIFEKFTEDSDPINDLGIGGFILEKFHDDIKNDAIKKWLKFLKDNLEGKKIKATMMRWDGRHDWKEYVIYVRNIVVDSKNTIGFDDDIAIQDKDGIFYTILDSKKINIIK